MGAPLRAAALGLVWSCAQAGDLAPVAERALYPEGPLWTENGLYYAEMTGDRVSRWDGRNLAVAWTLPDCGPTSVAPYDDGFVVLCHLADRLLVLDGDGAVRRTLQRDARGGALSMPNDSVADGRGGVYFSASGPFRLTAGKRGSVYHLTPAGTLRQVAAGVRYANGVTVADAGRTLLVSEHLGRRVLAYPILGDGGLGPMSVYLELDAVADPAAGAARRAGPDGLEMDRHGRLFIAEYGAGRVLVVGPDRRLIDIIELPERFVTNVALDADEAFLYVTAPASNSDFPYEGRVYRIPMPNLR